jgi:hypothetical protein
MKKQKLDQSLADADQTAANADQKVSGLDQGSADADDAMAVADQRASDRDQAVADNEHNTVVEVSPAAERAYDASKYARATVSAARKENRVKRARTGRDRDAAAGQRDQTATERDERGQERASAADEDSTAKVAADVLVDWQQMEHAMEGTSVDGSTMRVMQTEANHLRTEYRRLVEEEALPPVPLN